MKKPEVFNKPQQISITASIPHKQQSFFLNRSFCAVKKYVQ